jgi:hypothetical protein
VVHTVTYFLVGMLAYAVIDYSTQYIGIITPFGPAPGSIEGLIFTTLPFSAHMTGQIEIYVQSFLLSVVTFYWVTHPGKKWLNWVLSIVFFLALLLPTMGLLFG